MPHGNAEEEEKKVTSLSGVSEGWGGVGGSDAPTHRGPEGAKAAPGGAPGPVPRDPGESGSTDGWDSSPRRSQHRPPDGPAAPLPSRAAKKVAAAQKSGWRDEAWALFRVGVGEPLALLRVGEPDVADLAEAWGAWLDHLASFRRPTSGALRMHARDLFTVATRCGIPAARELLEDCINHGTRGLPSWKVKAVLDGETQRQTGGKAKDRQQRSGQVIDALEHGFFGDDQ